LRQCHHLLNQGQTPRSVFSLPPHDTSIQMVKLSSAIFWALMTLTSMPHVASLYTNGGACPVNFQPSSLYLRDIRTVDSAHPCGDCAISGGSCTLGFGGAYSCSSTQYLSWNYELCYPAVTNCPSNSKRVTTADMWVTDGIYNWQTAYFGCVCNAGYYYNSSTTVCTAVDNHPGSTQPITTPDFTEKTSLAANLQSSVTSLVLLELCISLWLAALLAACVL